MNNPPIVLNLFIMLELTALSWNSMFSAFKIEFSHDINLELQLLIVKLLNLVLLDCISIKF
jgi:hypothetical protein